MPYKNDNLDELFQKAAEDYPLRTDNPDWKKVAAKLNIPSAETTAFKKTTVWKYAAIIIILLASAAFLYDAQLKSSITQKNINNTADSKLSKNKIDIQSKRKPQQTTDNKAILNKSISLSANETTALNLQEYSAKANKIFSANAFHKSALPVITTANNNVITNLKVEKNNQPAPSANTKNNTVESLNNTDQTTNISALNVENNTTVNSNNDAVNKTNTTSSLNDNAVKAAETLVKYKAPPSDFYGSLYGGAEFSSIRGQKINNPGFKIGIALAYRINPRFDIEVGLQREKINYFTTGTYFDKSGLRVKDDFSLQKVDAASRLTSVPVTLRYNFKSKNNNHFYTGAGFNVLVLTHSESYQYSVIKNANGSVNDKTKDYKSITSAKYFTSINMSAGYQAKLSNWCNFKVEPYYQLPIAKLGVGKIPVTNFGVNVGIVKDLK